MRRSRPCSSFALSYDELLPDEFIAAAHLFRLDVAGFATVQKKRKLRAPKPEDDADLVALLKRALDSREAMYPTSLEVCCPLALTFNENTSSGVQDDDRLLLEKSLPLRRRMAVVVRRGEKVILRAAKSALEEAVASAPRSAKRARKA